MTIEHKNIVDPNIHEPKGVASAGAGTVYIANGVGSGVWGAPPVNLGYGSMAIRANGTGTVLAAAADTTLYTAAQYTPFTSYWVANVVDGISFSAGELQVPTDGVYIFLGSATIKSNTVNTVVGYKVTVNGAAQVGTMKVKCATAGDEYNVFGNSLITLTAGQKVGVAVAVDKNVTLTVTDASVSLIRVREL